MYIKLAKRNVRRQIGNYLIYFITVALTVALMFAVNNIIYCEQLVALTIALKDLNTLMGMLTALVSLIIVFVMGYATSFMLKLRKREFGMYLTLGMTRKNILSIFITETLIMCGAALVVGIFLGLFIYQGLMLLVMRILGVNMALASYSVKGLILTIVLVGVIFILASATSAIYLKKVSVNQLLNGDRMVEKNVRHPLLWFITALISLAVLVGGVFIFIDEIHRVLVEMTDQEGNLILPAFMAAVLGLIVFHIALSRSAMYLFLKNRRFCSRGTHTFCLRQLSGKLGANSIMAGILAFLLAMAIIGADFAFVQHEANQGSLEREYPFDAIGILDAESAHPISIPEAEKVVEEYVDIENKIEYTIYNSTDNVLYAQTIWSGEYYESLKDTFMKESDMNRLLSAMGEEPIHLNGGYMLVANVSQLSEIDFSGIDLNVQGVTYPYQGLMAVPFFIQYYLYAVVPDEAVEGLEVNADCVAYDFVQEDYNFQEMLDALSYEGDYLYPRSDFKIRAYGIAELNGNSAILIICSLYLAIVFVFMSMAILALKILSGLAEDRQKYAVLHRLGAGPKTLRRTLFSQIFIFFMLPFVVPLLLSIPAGIVCADIIRLNGFAELVGEIVFDSVLVVGIILGIYLIYFAATYMIAKRNVFQK